MANQAGAERRDPAGGVKWTYRRMVLLAAALIAALPLRPGNFTCAWVMQAAAQEATIPLNGIIEVGSKGVKAHIFALARADNDPGCRQDQDTYIRCLAPRTIATINANAIDPRSLTEVVQAVLMLRQKLVGEFAVAPERLQVIGSSGLAHDHPNSTALSAAIQKALGDTPRFSFVTAEQEAREFFIGATTMLPPDERQAANTHALFIDIGSGNLKGSFYDENSVNTFEVAKGTKTATMDIEGMRQGGPFAPAADHWADTVYRPLVTEEFDRRPGAMNRDTIYMAGGAVWALVNLTDPANPSHIPRITPQQIAGFVTRTDRPDAVSDLCTNNLDVNVNPEIKSVCKTFTIANLQAASRMLRVLSVQLDFAHKRVLFIRDSMVAWPLGYLREHPAEIQAPGTQRSAVGTVLRLHGSDTIGAALAPALLRRWVEVNGGKLDHFVTDAQDESHALVFDSSHKLPGSVQVFAHGSRTAVPDLLAHTADIGMMSDSPSTDELGALKTAGIDKPHNPDTEAVIGLDGIAIVLNPKLHVPPLSRQQIAALLSGQLTNWKEVGGPDLPVRPFHRPATSGTMGFVRKALGIGANTPLAGDTVDDNDSIANKVGQTDGAVSATGLAFVNGNQTATIDECGVTYPDPTAVPFYVHAEEYPLFRRLYLYRLPNSTSPWVEPFIQFATQSADAIVKDTGFVSQGIILGDSEVNRARDAEISNPRVNSPERGVRERAAIDHFATLLSHTDRVSVTFRFAVNDNRPDAAAEANLPRLRDFLYRPENSGRQVYVVGFASASGGDAHNFELAAQRARNIANRLRGYGNISIAEDFGVGKNLYVACNDENGALRNQRVEIWLERR